jgi:Bacterial SH3 domain
VARLEAILRRLAQIAVATGLLLAAACGGGSADDPTAAPPTSTITPAASSTTTPAPSRSPSETPEPSTATDIVSEDGLATLRIPEGALPNGVSPDDIQVVALDPADFADDLGEDAEAVAVYELLPDGLVLDAPVTIEIAIGELEEDATYLVDHVSGDDVEFPPTELLFRDSGESVLAVEIAHFSRVRTFIWRAGGGFRGKSDLTLPDGETHLIAKPFRVTVGWAVDPSNPTPQIPLNHGTLLIDPPSKPPSKAIFVRVSFDSDFLSLTASSTPEDSRKNSGDISDLTEVRFQGVNLPLSLTFVCKRQGIAGIQALTETFVQSEYEFFRDGRTIAEGTFTPLVLAKGSTVVSCTPEPGSTPVPAAETPAPSADPSVPPAVPSAVPQADTNLRAGPGIDYPVVKVVGFTDTLSLIGRNADGSWVKVRTSVGVEGWVDVSFISTFDSIPDLPIIEAPPLPQACTLTTTLTDLGDAGMPGQYDAIEVEVFVSNNLGEAVPGANVFVQNENSDDTTDNESGPTDANGIIIFEPQTVFPGENTFTITDVQFPGCPFDPSNSDLIITWQAE